MNRSIASGVLLLCLGWHLAVPFSQLPAVSPPTPAALQTAGADSGKSVWLPQAAGLGDLFKASQDDRWRGSGLRRVLWLRPLLRTPPAPRNVRPAAHRSPYPTRHFLRLRLVASGDEEAPA
jgi:hypothetical protein